MQVAAKTASTMNESSTATRTVKIRDVKENQQVVARNPRTGKTELKRVTAVSKSTVYELIKAEFADAKTGKVVETIKGTSEHPFFVEGRGFVPLADLGVGTTIVPRAGPSLVVKSLTREGHPEGVFVYNFEVEDHHTYFVGKVGAGIWVHNNCYLEINWNSNSVKTWGHTFLKHGAGGKKTNALTGTAASGSFASWP